MNKTLLFEQMITMRRFPTDAPKILELIKKDRLSRAVKAKQLRNFLLPVAVAFVGGAIGETVTGFTPPVGYELLVVGVTTNAGRSSLVIRPNVTAQADWSETPVLSQAVAGFPNFSASLTNIGFQDVQDLPVPFVLGANEQLAVDFVSRTAAAAASQTIVFHCLQVLAETDVHSQFQPAEQVLMEREVKEHAIPRNVYLRMDIAANVGRTRITDVPLLVLGATMNYVDDTTSTVKLNSSNDNYSFSEGQVPAWAMAGQITNRITTFLHFQRPHYLPRGSRLRGDFANANALSMFFKCQTL
jgi:hypothetical protein